MPNIKIELLSVDCLDNQNTNGNKHKLYLISTVFTKRIIKTLMTTFLQTTSEKTLNHDHVVLFEGTVLPNEKIKVVLILHDEEAMSRFSNYQELISQISNVTDSALLETQNQRRTHTSVTSTNILMNLEKDNLAYRMFEIDSEGVRAEKRNLQIKLGNCFDSTWCYSAQYQILRS